MKKRILIAVLLLVFLAGLLLFSYPKLSGIVTDRQTLNRTDVVIRWLETARAEQVEGDDEPLTAEEEEIYPPDMPQHHLALWRAAQAYNRELWLEKQSGLCDPFAYEQPSITLGSYGLENEAFGVLRIPALELELPIYLGASSEHLTWGVAHLSQTSLPIGGENTNCVLAGHRGWKGGTFFRHLEDLQIGDTVEIENLWTTLEYTVTGTEIIEPHEIEKLLIRPGEDRLTLFTCTRDGKRRFVVYCERVE